MRSHKSCRTKSQCTHKYQYSNQHIVPFGDQPSIYSGWLVGDAIWVNDVKAAVKLFYDVPGQYSCRQMNEHDRWIPEPNISLKKVRIKRWNLDCWSQNRAHVLLPFIDWWMIVTVTVIEQLIWMCDILQSDRCTFILHIPGDKGEYNQTLDATLDCVSLIGFSSAHALLNKMRG